MTREEQHNVLGYLEDAARYIRNRQLTRAKFAADAAHSVIDRLQLQETVDRAEATRRMLLADPELAASVAELEARS